MDVVGAFGGKESSWVGRMLARMRLAVGAQGLDRRRRSRRGWAGLGWASNSNVCVCVRALDKREGEMRGSEPRGMTYLERHLGPRWGRRRRRG